MLGAAALAISALAANAQSSSNPSMQPNPGGASKAETAGTKAKATQEQRRQEDPGRAGHSSTPSMAPTRAGTAGRIEAQNKGAKVKGAK